MVKKIDVKPKIKKVKIISPNRIESREPTNIEVLLFQPKDIKFLSNLPSIKCASNDKLVDFQFNVTYANHNVMSIDVLLLFRYKNKSDKNIRVYNKNLFNASKCKTNKKLWLVDKQGRWIGNNGKRC